MPYEEIVLFLSNLGYILMLCDLSVFCTISGEGRLNFSMVLDMLRLIHRK